MDSLDAGLPLFLALLFPLAFGGLWLAVSWSLSRMGWRTLARAYRAAPEGPAPGGQTLGFQSARMGRRGSGFGQVRYGSALWANCGPAGLHLSVMFLFRVGHPPLLLPWSALRPVQAAEPVLFGLGRGHRLFVALPDGSQDMELIITQKLADLLAQYQQPVGPGLGLSAYAGS